MEILSQDLVFWTTLTRKNKIVDLMSAGEADQIQPSTGAVESDSGMIVQSISSSSAVVSDARWSAVKSLKQEAALLFNNLAAEMETQNIPTATPVKATAVKTLGEASAVIPIATPLNTTEIQESGFFTKFFSKFRKVPSSTQPTPPEILRQPSDIPEVVHLMKEAIMEPNFLKEVKHSFRAYIQMEDIRRRSA